MFSVHDRVILITGAAGNLGQVCATVFFDAGAKLALIDRRTDRLAECFPDWVDNEQVLFAPPTDLTNADSVQAMVKATQTHFGRIDALINLAGGFKMGPPVHETDVATWDFLMELNARSVFLTSRAVAPHFIAQGTGRIVNIGARPGLHGAARMAPYGASKSAVIRLTESMAAELKEHGVTVNAVLPSIIDTPANRESMPKADFSTWVPPQDIAYTLLFLVSDAARSISGAAIPIYGQS